MEGITAAVGGGAHNGLGVVVVEGSAASLEPVGIVQLLTGAEGGDEQALIALEGRYGEAAHHIGADAVLITDVHRQVALAQTGLPHLAEGGPVTGLHGCGNGAAAEGLEEVDVLAVLLEEVPLAVGADEGLAVEPQVFVAVFPAAHQRIPGGGQKIAVKMGVIDAAGGQIIAAELVLEGLGDDLALLI